MTAPSNNTPKIIIADAMEDAGLLQDGQLPTSEQYVKYSRRLNDIINFEQTQGLKLWLNVDTSVTLVASQATYTFKPSGDVDMVKPLRVLQGYYLDANDAMRPLTSLSWQEYLTLGNLTDTGPISSYFVNKKAAELDVTFWLTPDAEAATGTAHVLLQTQVTNFISLTETMNFPQEWRMFLRWALADDICTGQPSAIVERCQSRAMAYRTMLEDWDVEDASTRFVPETSLTPARFL